ncbi:MAG: OmpA family protein [Acidobacteriaceae bacterium]|nr:OmpA family protein [Acidobacteriaceae bacterium]
MKVNKISRVSVSLTAPIVLFSALCMARVTPNTRTFANGENTKVQGVIVSRDGDVIKLRTNDDSIGTVDLTNTTRIQLKHGMFGRKTAMDATALVPGLQIQAEGAGNEKGDLVASKVIFDPNSMRASRQIDTRVSPLEARTGTLENRTGTLEGRTGTLEGRTDQLQTQQQQTQQQVGQVQTQVGQVKTEADQANQGVSAANGRISDLDNYKPEDTATVYFRLNSATLTPQAKQDLDSLAQKAQAQKGYVIEVAGYADKTGNASLNQQLSEARANAVIRYLEQQGNIPIHRILTPAGMGTSHEAAPNNTASGRKMNRRVEVKVLVNQGVVGGQSSASNQPQPGPGAPNQ